MLRKRGRCCRCGSSTAWQSLRCSTAGPLPPRQAMCLKGHHLNEESWAISKVLDNIQSFLYTQKTGKIILMLISKIIFFSWLPFCNFERAIYSAEAHNRNVYFGQTEQCHYSRRVKGVDKMFYLQNRQLLEGMWPAHWQFGYGLATNRKPVSFPCFEKQSNYILILFSLHLYLRTWHLQNCEELMINLTPQST